MTVKYELVVCMHSVCGKCMNLGWWISRLEHHFIQTGWIQMLKWIIWPHKHKISMSIWALYIHSRFALTNRFRYVKLFVFVIWFGREIRNTSVNRWTLQWTESKCYPTSCIHIVSRRAFACSTAAAAYVPHIVWNIAYRKSSWLLE